MHKTYVKSEDLAFWMGFTLALALVLSAQAKAETVATQAMASASVTAGVENIRKNKNQIIFTIPANARAFDDQAQGTVSGIYDVERKKPQTCPVVSSRLVEKDVMSYNPFNGRGTILATFDYQNMADAAYTARCLIIDDRD